MDIGAFNDKSKEMMMTERSYLEEMCPIFRTVPRKGFVPGLPDVQRNLKKQTKSHTVACHPHRRKI
jgi:hypothetical protein